MNATQLADHLHRSTFSISFAGNTILPAGARKEPYVHSIHSIHYIVSGKGTYVMNGVEHPIEAGKVMIFVPDTLFEWWIAETQDVEIYHIRFDYQMVYKDKQHWLSEPPDDGLAPLRGMLALERPQEVRLLFDKVYKLWKACDPISQYRCNLAFRELWLLLIENVRDQQYWSDTDSAIKFTCEYITEHYRSPLSIEQLAKLAGISTGHYSREFKRLFGFSPKEYIIRVKMNHAKELLGASEFNLTEISKLVGYEDEFYFSRVFKRITGITPSSYAKQMREQ
ncbi:AraC family transcriptional regulator [Paenibacillus allorhizosphaerae]|uniref:HTH-type transcriptional activator Btr n=1 Tax=Paenibacillus allorhizosphaerae TaxID=2849866 RepID=A0ABN7TM31_9BACL|nr:AraC family transcriptional regulator [Paenibacillus allorhizosphaerae]CAG7646475.1 HTH-type transcriptional activator Btr [Paenibacillus allorhizosphaerae]